MNELRKALDNLEQYAPDYLWGLVGATLSDPTVTSLAIGVLARDERIKRFFLGYAAARTVNSIANAIVTGAQIQITSISPPPSDAQ